jgi:alpha-methylacyl-CoA racemase
VGPDVCLQRNPGLVYARMTGWGQEGPLAKLAGHDINYAAIAGGLHPIGQRDAPPPPPLNLVADFGGGSLYLVMGVLAALVERASSGRGQVIDVAMVDGVASLTAMFHGLMASGSWLAERERNFLDGGAHFYTTYETADGGYMSVGALEPQFYAELLERLGVDLDLSQQYDREAWPRCKEQLADVFRSRTRAEWEAVFEGSDACVAPVLSLAEAPAHPHLQARGTFLDDAGDRLPAPAPRLSRTPGSPGPAFPALGQHTDEILSELGLSGEEVAALRQAHATG